MIRIVYVMDGFDMPLGGTERQFLALLERLDRAKFDPHLALLRRNPDLNGQLFPCPVSTLGLKSLTGLSVLRASGRFYRLQRQHRFHIAHLCMRDISRIGPLWGRGYRIPVVVGTRRNLGYHTHSLDRRLLRWISPLVTHTVANSIAAAETAIRTEGIDPSRVSVITNGLDHERFRPISRETRAEIRRRWDVPEAGLVVGSVANLRPIKNPMLLVDAAPLLTSRFPDLHVVMLGDGDLRPRLEARVAELGLEGRVHLPGVSDNVPADVQAFDVGVLCSDSESSPNAVIEYLAAGRPAVSANVGGAGEIILEGQTGFLFPPGDSRALAERLISLFMNSELRARMSDAAREDVALRFGMDRMVREHEALYERLLHQAEFARQR